MKIHAIFSKTAREVHAYDEGAALNKVLFHKQGRALLKVISNDLNLENCTISSNMGGIAVSGEITLHAEHLYLQVNFGFSGECARILYRSCKGKKDYSGGKNHYIDVCDLSDADRRIVFYAKCRALIEETELVAA